MFYKCVISIFKVVIISVLCVFVAKFVIKLFLLTGLVCIMSVAVVQWWRAGLLITGSLVRTHSGEVSSLISPHYPRRLLGPV